MALVIRNICNFYQYWFVEYQDPRVEHLPFLKSAISIIGLALLYLAFVLKWGQKLMKNRKPFELTAVINVYNFIQIFINLYIGVALLSSSYFRKDFSFRCQTNDESGSHHSDTLIFATYLYYLSKIVDLLDTVFFVLRKKNNQITFLHTYHHAGMVLATFGYNKFLSGSHGTLLFIINSFVHVIMYSYYFLTSFKPELKKSIWWKKHITQVQLLQFFILGIHFILPLITKNCGFPKTVAFIGLSQNVFMFVLFSDFYIKAYLKKKRN